MKAQYYFELKQNKVPLRAGRLLGLGILALCGIAGFYLLSRYNYLLFHAIVEIFSVVVAVTVFTIGWNTRKFARNDLLLVLAISFLLVGIIDFLHTLTYKGMGVFPDRGPNLPTQLWIAARYVQGLSFLLAAWILGASRSLLNPTLVLICYGLAGIGLLGTIAQGDFFPDCFVPGQGLTPFKVASEYVISTLLLVAAGLLWARRNRLSSRVLRLLLGSAILTILVELSFTLYVDVFGFFNVLGHLFKLLSIVAVYLALVQDSLSSPYQALFRDLARSEEEAHRARQEAEAATQAKGEFPANMSHEIRTPMNAVIGMTYLAMQTGPTKKQRDYLEKIDSAAKSLLGIINDILDFSKIESDKMKIERVGFNLE